MDQRNLRFINLRLKHKFTQQELGQRVGLSQSMIAHIEAGTKETSRLYKLRLAKEFDVSVEWLFYEQFQEGGKGYESTNEIRLSTHS
ncbi:helix-turn-helix transcriptional regulator [Alkalihalobacillus oceani]|uniref:helix-turn-helix transcriptional regulator n=1 Tax=Halalkalibacter oceani TaxID=1653776 RepID=UPI00203CB5DB|nr:helix-turn-helix transcriptional regulator [Halalkalibacter oceani]MCM3761836.1 helix-turn-helix transcriptional regulator [Halalkalibacter oceani]